jgi:23S rRNA (uracil1939-C5)-methyltransferase
MASPNDQLVLTIDKPAAGGRMIARLNDRSGHSGQVVFVAGAIPGERVTARVERVAKGVVYADTVTVEEPSSDRRQAAGDALCGGCLYSHIAYPRQLEIKSQVIADAFARIGRVQLPTKAVVVPSPEEGYRMRARLHVRGQRLGFFREGTHDVCDARQTRQLLPETCDVLDRLAVAMKSLGPDSVREVELAENLDAAERVVHLETASGAFYEDAQGHGNNRDRPSLATLQAIDGLTPGPYVNDVLVIGDRPLEFRRHVLAFFQGNRYLLRDLVAHVTECVPTGTALLDLYAGTGVFSVAAAAVRGASVGAVEGDRFAAADLKANALAAGAQLTTIQAAVEGFLASSRRTVGLPLSGRAIETIIVDPPRTGMSREALDGALSLDPSRLIYVSCDVATLARDSRRIVDAGYLIDRIDAFDLYPNTPHVETVVVFQNQG